MRSNLLLLRRTTKRLVDPRTKLLKPLIKVCGLHRVVENGSNVVDDCPNVPHRHKRQS